MDLNQKRVINFDRVPIAFDGTLTALWSRQIVGNYENLYFYKPDLLQWQQDIKCAAYFHMLSISLSPFNTGGMARNLHIRAPAQI